MIFKILGQKNTCYRLNAKIHVNNIECDLSFIKRHSKILGYYLINTFKDDIDFQLDVSKFAKR